jgi:hypothetical protein
MNEPWAYQLRVYLPEALAEAARRDAGDPALAPLNAVLRRHGAAILCQYDAFAAYVAEAEREGVENYPLYRWTRLTIDDPEKRAKHIQAFAVRVQDREVYGRAAADALEADLRDLVGGGVVTRISRHDTNPANNIPVPAHLRG